jgi:predicted RNA polymerase sigma factor
MKPDARQALEVAFRRSAARLVAQLYRRLGGTRLDLAEDATQFSLLQATRQWPVRGVPESPDDWLARVAHNRLTDLVRGVRPSVALDDEGPALEGPEAPREFLATEFDDDELRLLFATCHPALSTEAQVTLCLKLACGLSVREIARALLSEETAIAQRLVRARRPLQALGGPLEVPAGDALPGRLLAVQQALYGLFNEGYERTDGDLLVDGALCAEALRLIEGVLAHPVTANPEGHALAALFCFKLATLESRVDEAGAFVPAERRAPGRPELMRRGVLHLKGAMGLPVAGAPQRASAERRRGSRGGDPWASGRMPVPFDASLDGPGQRGEHEDVDAPRASESDGLQRAPAPEDSNVEGHRGRDVDGPLASVSGGVWRSPGRFDSGEVARRQRDDVDERRTSGSAGLPSPRARFDSAAAGRRRSTDESAGPSASSGPRLTRWHLEAELAFIHAQGPSTGWPWARILELYDDLTRLDASPTVALNRLVALAEVHGPQAALSALLRLPRLDTLEAWPWRHAVEAHLCRRLGRFADARRAFLRAADFAFSEAQRQFLLRQARDCADA